jgi:hypothetical protein
VERPLLSLETRFSLDPISSASGLVKIGPRLFIIADDELTLAEYTENGERIGTYPIPGEALPSEHRARKKKKPDFESLFFLDALHWAPGGALVAWPSFSEPTRAKVAVFPLAAGSGRVCPAEVYVLGSFAKKVATILAEPNLEGAAFVGETLWLFQRGNGISGENGLISLPFPNARAFLSGGGRAETHEFLPIDLGDLDGVRLGFTDGVDLPDGTLLALASAEASASTYEDGKVSGSAILRIQITGSRPRAERIAVFTETKKFEGMAIETSASGWRIWLIDDADDRERASSVSTAELDAARLGF